MSTTPTAEILTQRAEVSFLTKGIQPPAAIYVDREDELRIELSSSLGTLIGILLRGRLLEPTGEVIPMELQVLGGATRATVTRTFPLTEGFLLDLTAVDNSGTARVGEMYLRVSLVRGAGLGLQHMILLQGYVTGSSLLAWPGGLIRSPREGPGAIKLIIGTDPAAGVEVNETVPAGAVWRLISLFVQLTTSAVVNNRRPILVFDGGGANAFGRWPATTVIPASTVALLNWGDGMPVSAGVGSLTQFQGFPRNQYLLPSFRFRTSTELLDAGDNYTAPQYLVEEWLEQP